MKKPNIPNQAKPFITANKGRRKKENTKRVKKRREEERKKINHLRLYHD